MAILLLSCYELGHQPLSLAWPLAALQQAGFEAVGVDLAVEPFPTEAAQSATLVAISVPMHTALRLGVQAAWQVRALNPRAHICFYGLYAWLNADYLLQGTHDKGKVNSDHCLVFSEQLPIADSVIAGEYERPLVELAKALHSPLAIDHLQLTIDNFSSLRGISGISTRRHREKPTLGRFPLPIPNRTPLSPLSQYARYIQDGEARLAGYTETSRGCLHTCRHCPVVPVYHGRFFIVPLETVMTDIRQQVAAGAQHITFGDPDFLNGPGHALKVAHALHHEFPAVTFDFTTKVEHILKHRRLLPEFQALGATFVVSAFEATSDRVLQRLEKGHTTADLDTALDILQVASLPVQPTWVSFTPWTTLNDYLHLLKWIRTRHLIPHVPIVQLSIRLLVPPGSALLNHPDVETWRGALDAANFTYHWAHPDPCMDELQQAIAALAEHVGDDPYENFAAVEQLAYRFAGRPAPAWKRPLLPYPVPPRLTEDWFC